MCSAVFAPPVNGHHLAELLDTVWSKGHKARAPRRRLHALNPIVSGGIAPQKVHENDAALLHGQGPLQRIDLIDAVYAAPNTWPQAFDKIVGTAATKHCISALLMRTPHPSTKWSDKKNDTSIVPHTSRFQCILVCNPGLCNACCSTRTYKIAKHTAVHAEHFVLNTRRQREPIEQCIQPRPSPDAMWVAQALYTLDAEAKQGVDVGCLRVEEVSKGVIRGA